jgi:hypothetical protein
MELQGTWIKDEDGYLTFSESTLERYYEMVTTKFHQVYNQFLEELDDDEEAHEQTLSAGYEMVTDYKLINDQEEFATTYHTPAYVLDIWYELDDYTQKRIYDRGFIRVSSKAG